MFFKDFTGSLAEVPQASGLASKKDLVKLHNELKKGHELGEDSNATGHGVVTSFKEMDDILIASNENLDQKKSAMLEAMDERYDKGTMNRSRSNSQVSR